MAVHAAPNTSQITGHGRSIVAPARTTSAPIHSSPTSDECQADGDRGDHRQALGSSKRRAVCGRCHRPDEGREPAAVRHDRETDERDPWPSVRRRSRAIAMPTTRPAGHDRDDREAQDLERGSPASPVGRAGR